MHKGHTSITRTATGGKYSIRHWKSIVDTVGKPDTDQLPTFKKYNVPQSEMKICLDNLGRCLSNESIPELLRDVPYKDRDRSWLFLNPYTVLFKISPIFPMACLWKRLQRRQVCVTHYNIPVFNTNLNMYDRRKGRRKKKQGVLNNLRVRCQHDRGIPKEG